MAVRQYFNLVYMLVEVQIKMVVVTTMIVAFDYRYMNEWYHGIGCHACNLLDALTRLNLDWCYPARYHPGYGNTRFN